ncbi:hypothetical protein [Nonomuraea jabiensis]|uniref:Site-specific recombinase XerD n=1 Tax=Nonomuraea jabiensis TaxID=882448 RepID=A0A7W9GD67_9ACTN|nr:hypothetical protein [Nonomuraea jabiensis]MBB5781508.1 site-specific recombinase XerD [Nonomuraea jabiensis]
MAKITIYRLLYETAARAAEILALNVEDLDLEHRGPTRYCPGGNIGVNVLALVSYTC